MHSPKTSPVCTCNVIKCTCFAQHEKSSPNISINQQISPNFLTPKLNTFESHMPISVEPDHLTRSKTLAINECQSRGTTDLNGEEHLISPKKGTFMDEITNINLESTELVNKQKQGEMPEIRTTDGKIVLEKLNSTEDSKLPKVIKSARSSSPNSSARFLPINTEANDTKSIKLAAHDDLQIFNMHKNCHRKISNSTLPINLPGETKNANLTYVPVDPWLLKKEANLNPWELRNDVKPLQQAKTYSISKEEIVLPKNDRLKTRSSKSPFPYDECSSTKPSQKYKSINDMKKNSQALFSTTLDQHFLSFGSPEQTKHLSLSPTLNCRSSIDNDGPSKVLSWNNPKVHQRRSFSTVSTKHDEELPLNIRCLSEQARVFNNSGCSFVHMGERDKESNQSSQLDKKNCDTPLETRC